MEKFFHSRSKRLSISIGFVLLTVGLSMVEFELGGIHFGFSLLLVCMMTGTIFCNICDFSEELMSRVDGWTAPLFVLFFVLSGAELNLKILSNPMVLLIGLVYIVFRSLGKYLGAYGSCALTGCSDSIKKHLGVTLLPQAGVALGMALTAQQLADGAVVRSVVLFSVLVYELVGPALTKRSLVAAGEIHEAGRTSARKKNEPNAPVQLDKEKPFQSLPPVGRLCCARGGVFSRLFGHTSAEVMTMLSENQLLNHIYQTAEMGQEGIRSVLKYAGEPKLISALNSQLTEYEKLQNAAGSLLHARGEPPKGLGPVTKASSEVMSTVKAMTDRSPANIAEMMIQGSTMGVTKSLRTIRECDLRDEGIRRLADRLLKTEQSNIEEMKRFL